MFIVQESLENHGNFTLYLPAANSVIILGNQNDPFVQNIPEPPISEHISKSQLQIIKKENRNITWMEFSKDKQYFAVTLENKQLIVYDKNFLTIKNILLPRVSCKVCFSPTNDILVADRAGDVYLYKMADEKNEPTLLLGHLSVILDILITECGNYIITCDRDEKIRVSHYPNAYNIATYCLGHTQFVVALKLLKNNNILLSASGDGTIGMWDYLEGKQVNSINTRDLADEKAVQKFVSQMNSEKVVISNIPITDMQVHEKQSNILLVVSLHGVGQLYLYNINPRSLEYSYLRSINISATEFSYCLLNRLYVLTSNLNIYEFFDNNEPVIVTYKSFEDKLLDYKDFYTSGNSDITLLYKRRYDNIQEYFERKKFRLETQ